MELTKEKLKKAKAGLLLIASPRFKNLGKDLPRGSYAARKELDLQGIVEPIQETLELINPGIIYGREDMQSAMDLCLSEKVDFIIIEFMSWAEDAVWVRFLRDMPEMPMIFVNPAKDKMTFETTVDEDDFIDFLSSGTLVGSLEASGSISRVGRKDIKVVMGNRVEIAKEILSFSKAAKVRSILRKSTFGLLANYNDLMWSTYIDPYNLFTRIGPELQFISYSMLADKIGEVTDGDTEIYKNELTTIYKVADDLNDRNFFESVRASIGLARIMEDWEIDGMVFNDLDRSMFKLIGLRPGFYHPTINKNLSVLVPEADTGACVITYILKLLSNKQVNFIEPFHIEAGDNTFTGGHAGPNDHNNSEYNENVIIAPDVRFAKTNYKYAGAPFAWNRIPPGRKTMAHFSENNGKYKLVCTLVDSLEGKHILASYSHSVFRPIIPVKELFEKILNIGTTQHFAVVDGNYLKELSNLAEIMGFEYHELV